ncbi:GTPase IMAP family member 8-like isoform 1-T1 [Polymixia lowei]
MASGDSASESEDLLSELRIVLIGRKPGKSGEANIKSAVGNIILGEEVFDTDRRTIHSVMRQREVFGKKITVVNTPDWIWNNPLGSTPMMDQLEIKRSVHLCPPGPHTFLLVVQTSNLEEIEEHTLFYLEEQVLLLFSNRFWMHTVLLLLGGDTLISPKIEKTLGWLIEKCEFCFHVLDTRDISDGSQARQLLGIIQGMVSSNHGDHYQPDRGTPIITLFPKIDAMVTTNNNCHYKVDKDTLSKLSEQKSTLEKMMGQMTFFKDEHQSQRLKTPLRIMLLGKCKVGKRAVANAILKQGARVTSLAQLYKDSEIQNLRCRKTRGTIPSINLSLDLVDVPTWSTTTPSRQFREDILDGLNLCSPGPHAFLLVVPLTESFSEDDRAAVEEHMKLLGKNAWQHTLVVFCWGFWLGERAFWEYVESRGEALKWLVERCGYRYHVLDCLDWDDVSRETEMTGKLEVMTIRARRHLAIGGKWKRWTQFRRRQGKDAFAMEEWIRKEEEWLRREQEWRTKEAEWRRREKEMTERMQRAGMLDAEDSKSRLLKRSSSIDKYPPSFSGSAPSEARSDGVFQKVSEWLSKRRDTLSSLGYDSMTTHTEADMADMSRIEEDIEDFI